jgi:hypothetical protein
MRFKSYSTSHFMVLVSKSCFTNQQFIITLHNPSYLLLHYNHTSHYTSTLHTSHFTLHTSHFTITFTYTSLYHSYISLHFTPTPATPIATLHHFTIPTLHPYQALNHINLHTSHFTNFTLTFKYYTSHFTSIC